MTVIDVKALRMSAERQDAGPMAVVSRKWLGDVLTALLEPGETKLLLEDSAPTPMVSA